MRFVQMAESIDLTLLPPIFAAAGSRLAVLGRADCADGAFAVTVRELLTGEAVRCIPLAGPSVQ